MNLMNRQQEDISPVLLHLALQLPVAFSRELSARSKAMVPRQINSQECSRFRMHTSKGECNREAPTEAQAECMAKIPSSKALGMVL
jgi:hypothetical protein